MNNSEFQSIIKEMSTIKDKNSNSLNMDSIYITEGNNTFKHNFKNEELMNDMRSISKPIISLSLGIAINEGLYLNGEKINLDTKIYPFFENIVKIKNTENIEKLKLVTLRHLLTHSIGFNEGLLFSKDLKEMDLNKLLEYIFNYNITHEPGTTFVYSNVGPYIISALIQEYLNINLADWVNEVLFKKLDIKDFEWKNYGPYCAGATGLKLKHKDLHKVGLLLKNKGKYDGLQIVPSNWVEMMTSFQVGTPNMYDKKRVFPKYGYGFFMYICDNETFYCDGTDGQYLIVIPKKDILISTFGHQSDMKPITECFRKLS